MTNQDGCDCNASEQAYNRPLCQYHGRGHGRHADARQGLPGHSPPAGAEGLRRQRHRRQHLSEERHGRAPAPSDPNYGYNPAVGAIIDRLKEALVASACRVRSSPTRTRTRCPARSSRRSSPRAAGACSCSDFAGPFGSQQPERCAIAVRRRAHRRQLVRRQGTDVQLQRRTACARSSSSLGPSSNVPERADRSGHHLRLLLRRPRPTSRRGNPALVGRLPRHADADHPLHGQRRAQARGAHRLHRLPRRCRCRATSRPRLRARGM